MEATEWLKLLSKWVNWRSKGQREAERDEIEGKSRDTSLDKEKTTSCKIEGKEKSKRVEIGKVKERGFFWDGRDLGEIENKIIFPERRGMGTLEEHCLLGIWEISYEREKFLPSFLLIPSFLSLSPLFPSVFLCNFTHYFPLLFPLPFLLSHFCLISP